MREFAVRHTPMMSAVACEDGIPRVGVNRAFRGPHDGVDVREAYVDLALQLFRFDVLRVTQNFRGKSALSATAKYQRIASFVIL
jgi:hypothetical protein